MTTLNTDDKVALIINALDDLKAQNITVLDIAHLTEVAERMIICEGTSKRHIGALADKLVVATKSAGLAPLGREGDKDSDWVLVDLNSVVVHIMTKQAREFYDLEGLWSSPESLKALMKPTK